ncbi:MAG: signal peptidase II [Polyangiaceae bacterium]|nr:signal peptidase II [Polyangiaceae bacterium]
MGLEAPTVVPPESPPDVSNLPVSTDTAPVVGKVDGVENSNWRPSNWFLVVTAFLVAAADLGSKEWAKWAIAGPDLKRTGKHIEVIPNYLDFIFAQNPGGAWSFLRGVPDGLRRPFFLFVSSAAIVFIVGVYRRLDKQQWAMRWGLPLALGGAIGNLVDRARYGWVCDFIDVYWKGKANEMHWPTFNVADIAIVVGVLLMAFDLNLLRKPKTPDETKAAQEPARTVA